MREQNFSISNGFRICGYIDRVKCVVNLGCCNGTHRRIGGDRVRGVDEGNHYLSQDHLIKILENVVQHSSNNDISIVL